MKTGLVLEGGGSRGVFTTGVLDLMLERGLDFSYCVGVSAGAGNAMNFKSRQAGRALSIVGGGASYIGLDAARRTGRLLDLELVYDELSFEGDHPFDFAAYYRNPMQAEYTLTSCETGQSVFLSENVYHKRLVKIVMASCSIPGVCAPVELDGQHYVDGGVADPMPVRHAFDQGCDRVVLITTKPRDDLHPTDYRKIRHLLETLYGRKYPALVDAMMTRLPRYFEEMAWIEEEERAGRVFVIRPEHCHIHTLERDLEKLRPYYLHGRQIGEEQWDSMLEYLNA